MINEFKVQKTTRCFRFFIESLFEYCFSFFFPLQTTTTALPDLDPTPSTQRYRITRKELGYILGRNYRGLKKLYNIEIMDALNVN